MAKAQPSQQPSPTTAVVAPEDVVTKQIAPLAAYDQEDFGAGFEDFTADDVAVPFVSILQKGSPQVEEDNPKYIPGAKPGMFFNTVSNQLYDGKERGITVIPVHRVRSFIEWIPKDDGGGLVNVFAPDAPEVVAVLEASGKKFGKHEIGDGNDLVETFSMFALLLSEDGTYERVVLSFSSSQIGVYKRWMTMAQSVQLTAPNGRLIVPPMFAHRYRLRTSFTQKKDYTWYKFAVAWDGAPETAEASRLAPTDPYYLAAKEFRAMVVSGGARANYEATTMDDHEMPSATAGNEFDM